MASHPSTNRPPPHINRNLFRLAVLIITSLLVMASLVLPIAMRPSTYPLQVGDVAQQDINAPLALSFQSELLTEEARQEAMTRVEPVFTTPDQAITRQQIEQFKAALNYISTVRQENFATLNQQ